MGKEYKISDFENFIVTGCYYNNSKKRFKSVYSNWFQADGINLWRGNVWGVLKGTNKRIKLKSVYN